MTRRFTERRLVLATHNAGKAVELRALLAPWSVGISTSGELGLPEPEETEATFVGNARLKAHTAAERCGLPVLADDSGLVCAGLDGAPGVHSARWAGPERDFGKAMAAVTGRLAERFGSFAAADRRASFVAVLCLVWPDREEAVFEGRVDGTLVERPRGSHGFGYDPIFVPEGESLTFGEMDPARKQRLSHRARAFAALVQACFAEP